MKRTWMMAASVGLAAVLVGVSSALAAYTSPKLEVRQVSAGIAIKASLSPDDDATARIAVIAPPGTQLTTAQAPGTVLGPVRGLVKVLDLGGGDVPFEGQLLVATPGQISAAEPDRVSGFDRADRVVGDGCSRQAGQTLPAIPRTSSRRAASVATLGPAAIVVCLPPPDVPAGTPGRAPFGVKLYSAELTVKGVFSPGTGTWVSSWTPYTPGAGAVNQAGTVVAPAALLPGVVTAAAKRAGSGAVVSGRVTQGGQPRAGATVTIRGGPKASALRRLGSVKTKANGSFSFRARTGTFFRASAVAAAGRGSLGLRDAGTRPRRDPVREPDGQRVHGREPNSPEAIARTQEPAAQGPTLPRMPATVRIGTCSFADEGLVKTWYPRGVSTRDSPAALLRGALRHRRGGLALLPPPGSGRHRSLGAADARRIRLPCESARHDDAPRGGGPGAGVRSLP